ncbi:MAG: MFS transporter [Saprospiraceae bacterium]|nr:MFS transporter [Saprospiraceae bacterium]
MSKRKHTGKLPVQELLPVKAPLSVLALFSLGQFGWSLASYAVGNLLVYFYLPPEQGTPMFPAFIFQGPVLWFFTLIGLISALGRILDGVVDPLVANWSDRKDTIRGKRKWFMLRGAIPFALFGALAFFPAEASEAGTNVVWIGLVIGLYYFFFAFYVIPYNALMAELGHTPKERLRISTMVSVAWALGFVAGNSMYALQGFFESRGDTPLEAFQTGIIWLQAVALVCMLLPALFLNEMKYARQVSSDAPVLHSVRSVFGNKNFRWFLFGILLYWLALTFIQLGIGYYTTLLLGLDKSEAFSFSLISFGCSFIFYFPVSWMAGKYGKRHLMLGAFIIFALIFLITAFSPYLPVPKLYLMYGLAVAASVPLAIFGILPNAIVGDEVEKTVSTGGLQVTGMYFGVTAFTMKIGISIANLVFPSLLLFGRSLENAKGVQLTSLAAAAFCLLGWLAFRRFRE